MPFAACRLARWARAAVSKFGPINADERCARVSCQHRKVTICMLLPPGSFRADTRTDLHFGPSILIIRLSPSMNYRRISIIGRKRFFVDITLATLLKISSSHSYDEYGRLVAPRSLQDLSRTQSALRWQRAVVLEVSALW